LKFKSLKTRILFWFGSITFIVLLIFSFSFYFLFEKNTYSTFEEKLYKEAIFVKDNYLNDNEVYFSKKGFLSSKIAVFENGKIIKQTDDFNLDYIIPYMEKEEKFQLIHNHEIMNVIYTLKINDNLKIILYEDGIDDKIEDIIETMIIIEPLLFFILLFLASKLIDKILIPIKNITNSANNITINNFSNTISSHIYNDEISELIKSFNTMIQRLQDGVKNLDRFNSDVSHELRTPLTVIRGEIEVSLRKTRESSYYIDSMNTIHFEIKQIENIIENLLLITKYSKENIKKTFLLSSVDSILLDIIYKYNNQIKNKNINLIINQIDSINEELNPSLLKTIFSNLLDNAIKYTSSNKNITINLYKKEKIHFIIEDEGIGISKENLPLIMNRFYRVDKSRNKNIEGFGLGLSIVKNSVDLHNGKISIDSILNKGTKVEVIL
jgi:signal transduction histidine kinase